MLIKFGWDLICFCFWSQWLLASQAVLENAREGIIDHWSWIRFYLRYHHDHDTRGDHDDRDNLPRMTHSLKRVKNELIHSESDFVSPFLLPIIVLCMIRRSDQLLMRLDHKTELRSNLDDLGNLDRGRLELLGVAELAIRVEDLWSKDIVDLPEKKVIDWQLNSSTQQGPSFADKALKAFQLTGSEFIEKFL